jgi:LysR family cyn operon transcriptional activator
MDLQQLRSFVAVAEAGGFSKAAPGLRLSQPALWRQVRALEAELGVRLFDRVGRRVRLTGPGQDLVTQGRDLLARAESLGERARTFAAGDAGVLNLGATPQTLESLASFLARWRRAFPRVSLHLIEDGGAQLLDRLEAGEIHLALTVAGDPRFHFRLLRPIRLLAVARAGHRIAHGRTVEVANLARETLLLLRSGFGSREWLDAACRVLHVRPQILVESGAPSTLIALARAGHGVAVIPSTVRFSPLGTRALAVVHAGTPLGRWLAANWDPRRFMPPYVERFVRAVAVYSERHPGRELGPVPPVPTPP